MKTTKTSLIKFHSTVSGINLIYVAFNYPLLHFTICLMVNFVKHLYFGFHFFAPLSIKIRSNIAEKKMKRNFITLL